MKHLALLLFFCACIVSLAHAQQDSLYGLKISARHVSFVAGKYTTRYVRYKNVKESGQQVSFTINPVYNHPNIYQLLPAGKKSVLYNILNVSGNVFLGILRDKKPYEHQVFLSQIER